MAEGKNGRPTVYTAKVAMEICTLIATGMPLTKICRREGMPCLATVYNWLLSPDHRLGEKSFLDMYTLAREDQADTLADEIIEIADDGRNDTYVDGNGNTRENRDVTNRSRLRVDARKWVAAKLKPRKYSDRTFNETTLNGGETPV